MAERAPTRTGRVAATESEMRRAPIADVDPVATYSMASSDKGASRAVMRLSPPDNVAVALRPLKSGESVLLDGVALSVGRNIAVGHKLAARTIEKGEIVLKYGCPIGTATCRIAPGEYVHTHNVESNYLPTSTLPK